MKRGERLEALERQVLALQDQIDQLRAFCLRVAGAGRALEATMAAARDRGWPPKEENH